MALESSPDLMIPTSQDYTREAVEKGRVRFFLLRQGRGLKCVEKRRSSVSTRRTRPGREVGGSGVQTLEVLHEEGPSCCPGCSTRGGSGSLSPWPVTLGSAFLS